jgi:hypothetical protein
MSLNRDVRKIDDLKPYQMKQMYSMMDKYYNNMRWSNFIKDLMEKDYIITITDEQGDVKGFTTQKILSQDVNNIKVYGLFSGDTISEIDNTRYNCSLELFKHGFNFAIKLSEDFKDKLFYWFLISKGFRTYRLLQYFKEFYPRYDQITPEFEQKIIDTFGCNYSDKYNLKTGIIQFDGLKDNLKHGVYCIGERQMKNPHIKYFLNKNPDWSKGNELVCLAKLSNENITKAGQRILKNNEINKTDTMGV